MNFAERVEYIKRIDGLVRRKSTGTPEELAARLKKCRATIYNHIEDLRGLGAEVAYCKRSKTFYYEAPFELPFK
ncbi:MAG: HTH domain-containing protein [Lewinellaceae bacterium]|nr:HTH domain-containing protein [Saprospiraceae bacterium]MCB9337744.1 HTH domain-containing protein [Lewinellaceae bacterium]